MNDEFLEQAQEGLALLRQGTVLYEEILQFIANGVEGGYFTLEKVGTKEEELRELYVKGCRATAEKILANLRSVTDFAEQYREQLRKNLPQEISADDGQITDFWIAQLSEGFDPCAHQIALLQEQIEKGGLSLGHFGCSPEELVKIHLKGVVTACKKWLGYIRAGDENSPWYIDILLQFELPRLMALRTVVSKPPESTTFSLGEIETTGQELEVLRSRNLPN